MRIQDLETPAVLIDLDVMERNLTRMAEYCRRHGLALRPHTKTHKIPELAHRQIESGASGITVAKVGEAEVMSQAGLTDILIAYPIVGREKATRVAALAERTSLMVSLDSEEAARDISTSARERGVRVGLLVELDVGFRRCGVSRPEDAIALARVIQDLPNVEFRGLMFYPGHFMVPEPERRRLLEDVNARLLRFYEAFDRVDLPIAIVSGGSTPTAYLSHEFVGVTEIRPGMYIFNDRTMVGLGVARLEDCALSVLVTVVSTSVSGRAIVDGGSKTFSNDRYRAGDGRGFGLVREDPEAEVEALSEEHGHLDISRSSRRYRVGERLTIIPNHVCTVMNLHDEVYGVRGDRVEVVWRVAARGRVR
ncbi:MAG: alanine racemase [Blastocatellia bacterium]|nr:alanine racemase [Blastocatellia bacterium]MCS7157166.1 alanine racemase [Blastocatellia bacterium]MCX7752371.1 alanine racemase [Blastocatellia bacterium]MDW8167252.1 alanine racemase [Acidobacteriota bacterium]